MNIQLIVLLVSFVMTLIVGIILIPFLTRLKFGQVVRDDGPKAHLRKTGTPTMGGIIFLIPLTIVCGWFSFQYPKIFSILMVVLLFGLIGFIDDYIKVVLKRAKGLSARHKMLGLLIVSTIFAFVFKNYLQIGTEISIPFISNWIDFSNFPLFFSGKTINLEWLFIPFIILVFLATTNSVNLTDGLDGLAAGICLIIMIFFTIVAIAIENMEMIIFSTAVSGVCLGFLAFNMYPAKVFMGDTGSLALGGAITSAAVMMNMPLVLIIVAGICVLEACSVIIQVIVFKKTGKRAFRMAPVHHHFELSGWSENRVVWTFWATTVILCIIGLLSLRYTII